MCENPGETPVTALTFSQVVAYGRLKVVAVAFHNSHRHHHLVLFPLREIGRWS